MNGEEGHCLSCGESFDTKRFSIVRCNRCGTLVSTKCCVKDRLNNVCILCDDDAVEAELDKGGLYGRNRRG